MSLGFVEGERCGRGSCTGEVREHPVEGCACHIAPPCSACTTPRGYCVACGWEERDDEIINDYVVNVDRATGTYRMWTPRPLDNTRIDYRTKAHTNSSQVCEGVYPEGTTRAEVEALVRGTFGGRFDRFGNGEFRYVAYTD
jgi:hypothetical protein